MIAQEVINRERYTRITTLLRYGISQFTGLSTEP